MALALREGLLWSCIAGSALAIAAGFIGGQARRTFAMDGLSLVLFGLIVLMFRAWPLSRDAAGVLFVSAVVVRFAPAFVAFVWGRRSWLAFAAPLGVYIALAVWLNAASYPYGDQVHYLLATDRLAQGSLDATVDVDLFQRLIGVIPSVSDVATHVVDAPAGPRTVQGYLLALVLLPGWIGLGRLGAEIALALVAAFAVWQTYLLLRETVPHGWPRNASWLMVALLPPLLPLATHLYPNAIGAAIIVTAYRYAFTRSQTLPALAGALLGLTFLLTPRDAIAIVVLLPMLWLRDRSAGRRFAMGLSLAFVMAAGVNLFAYGIPLPYVGYFYGTVQAQALEHESSITLRFWVGLPAMLFDRTFGLAGSASWLFIGALGLWPALRARREALLPAALTIGASFVGLSLFRYWEGGYAPPNRYIVDVLPLVAPLVAYGLMAARSLALRAILGLLVALSALAAIVFSAAPGRALNSAFEGKLQDVLDRLPLNPIGWLPNFQPLTADWYISAYLRVVPAAVLVGLFVWLGSRSRHGHRAASGPPPRSEA